MRYQTETYGACMHDLEALMEGHWDVTDAFNDHAEIQLDHERFALTEKLGRLVTVTARDEHGALQGIVIWSVFEDPKHKGHFGARDAHFFVSPKARGHMIGSRLITESERIMRRMGVNLLGICVKNQDEFMPLVKRHGFDRPQTTWYKWIGD